MARAASSPDNWRNQITLTILYASEVTTLPRAPYNRDEDWIFASPEESGQQPTGPTVHCEGLFGSRHCVPNIVKHIGWHTFRHSFATLLKANGEDVKVVQESLRHANSRITLDVYT